LNFGFFPFQVFSLDLELSLAPFSESDFVIGSNFFLGLARPLLPLPPLSDSFPLAAGGISFLYNVFFVVGFLCFFFLFFSCFSNHPLPLVIRFLSG